MVDHPGLIRVSASNDLWKVVITKEEKRWTLIARPASGKGWSTVVHKMNSYGDAIEYLLLCGGCDPALRSLLMEIRR